MRTRLAATVLLAGTFGAGEALACKCGWSSYGETVAAVPVVFEGGVESSRVSDGRGS